MSTLELTTASGELIPVTRFRMTESVSTLFSIELRAHVDDAVLDLSAIAGHTATFRASAGHVHSLHSAPRSWSGIIRHAEQVHAVPAGLGQVGLSTYLFRLVPDAYRLTQRRDNRIFQQRSIPDVVEEVLAEHSIP